MTDKSIFSFADYGVQRLFGEAFSDDLLLALLNELLGRESDEMIEVFYLSILTR